MADESNRLLESPERTSERRRLIRNAVVLNMANMLLYAGDIPLSAVQTSVHSDGNVGAMGMAAGAVGCLAGTLLSGVVINLIGNLKWTLTVCFGLSTLGPIANFAPVFPFFVTACAVSGFVFGIIMVAREVYTAQLGHQHTDLDSEQTEDDQKKKSDPGQHEGPEKKELSGRQTAQSDVGLYNPGLKNASSNTRFSTQGWFFLFHLSSSKLGPTLGHLAASYILGADEVLSDHNQTHSANSSWVGSGLRCGSDYCNEDLQSDFNDTAGIERRNIFRFLEFNLCLTILATALLIFFLDDLGNNNKKKDGHRFSWSTLVVVKKSFLSVATNSYFILLVPVFLSTAGNDAFFTVDFTKAFVTCSLKMSSIGFVMMWSGIGFALASVLFGWQSSGWMRRFSILFSRTLQVALAFALVIWNTAGKDNLLTYFCIITATWSFATGIVMTLSAVLTSCLFRDNLGMAISSMHVWMTVAVVVVYLWSNWICTDVKLFALIVLMIASAVSYVAFEFKLHIDLVKINYASK